MEDADDGHCYGVFDQRFEAFGKTAVAVEPTEDALDHPTSWDHLEPVGVRWSFDNLLPKVCASCIVRGNRALIVSVGEETA